ncbi:patatin-like phospholipase family protein [Agrobacterium sp. SHOUNA12C]|nr:patatin-like phospholipase family protein [Agrobacterium sp. BETTINA12B]MCJ9755969.1 patatin-like phospholipase family protein [Agrobacterium sp. SHOUNA12C]
MSAPTAEARERFTHDATAFPGVSALPNRDQTYYRHLCLLIILLLPLAGCMTVSRPQYRADQSSAAEVPGFPGVRSYLDEGSSSWEDAFDWQPAAAQGDVNYLMISGGGAGGAFSAGVLSAWTKTGKRPRFDIVSGVSTGALIAPFAFLGSSYDDLIAHLYTSGVAKNLVDRRLLPNQMLGKSLLRGRTLRSMVDQYITQDVLDAVAREHRNGRRLLVLTSNLDSQRAVVWNMGAIAASGRPGALQLFRDVLVASASIPGVYPPVLIKAQAGDRHFQELHSDGGSSSQILTFPSTVLASASHAPRSKARKLNIFVLVNNALMPEFSNTSERTLPVMARAYATLIKAQERDALMALYGWARRTGATFHAASIDCQIPYDIADPFNDRYMRAVFTLGARETLNGTLWNDVPLFTTATSNPECQSVPTQLSKL